MSPQTNEFELIIRPGCYDSHSYSAVLRQYVLDTMTELANLFACEIEADFGSMKFVAGHGELPNVLSKVERRVPSYAYEGCDLTVRVANEFYKQVESLLQVLRKRIVDHGARVEWAVR